MSNEEAIDLFRFYPHFVNKLFKEMGSPSATLMHGAVGVAGEAGELLDAVKKFWVYNKPLDIENVIEELGDMFFYMQDIMNRLNLTWPQIINANVEKLRKRYPEGYSDAAAQARMDKKA